MYVWHEMARTLKDGSIVIPPYYLNSIRNENAGIIPDRFFIRSAYFPSDFRFLELWDRRPEGPTNCIDVMVIKERKKEMHCLKADSLLSSYLGRDSEVMFFGNITHMNLWSLAEWKRFDEYPIRGSLADYL